MSFVEDRSVLTLASRAPDRQIRYGDDPLHIADVWESRPAAGGPLVVLIHGGFWRPAFDRLHLGPFANAIADAGFTVASVEYRRVPASPDLTTGDVALACSRVPKMLGSKENRAVVVGHSAGGHLALWSATAVTASALSIVALAPAASLAMSESLNLGSGAASAFLGTSAAERRDLDPYELSSAKVPVSIIHGSADEIVPASVSEHFQRKHAATRLQKVADAGHFAMIDPRSVAWPVIIDEIKRLAATDRESGLR